MPQHRCGGEKDNKYKKRNGKETNKEEISVRHGGRRLERRRRGMQDMIKRRDRWRKKRGAADRGTQGQKV